MKRWFTRIFATIGILVVLVVAAGIIGFLAMREQVPDNTVLVIDFEQPVIESVPADPLARAMLGNHMIVRDVIDAIDAAAEDDRVQGLIGRVGSGHAMAVTQEFRQAVERFRASGKPALAFAETIGEVGPGNTGYYLATAFDEIYLQESGDIGLVGLISESLFLRGTLDKLELDPRMDHRHEYKTAMNVFTEEAFTDAHREVQAAIVESLFEVMAADIARTRGMSAAEFVERVERGPYLGAEAVDAGLIDGLAYRDEVHELLEERIGTPFETLGPGAYLKLNGRPHQAGSGVALIYGNGAVVRGQSGYDPIFGSSSMGSDTVTRAFRDAIDDDEVEAIIFRVDSPGGSYVASDAIWRMTLKAREAGKPVVVTMGNVAGSGGYFVAMAADRIIAQPGTITGSIGVLGGKFLTGNFWENKLGVTWDSVQSTGNAAIYSGLHDYTEHGWARHRDWLDRIYDDFTAKVAGGRGLSRDAVHEVAKGRIWTGSQSLTIDLIDATGGFGEAYAAVRELLDIEADAPLKIKPFPRQPNWFELLAQGRESPTVSASAQAAVRTLEEIQPAARALRRAGLLGDAAVLEVRENPEIR